MGGDSCGNFEENEDSPPKSPSPTHSQPHRGTFRPKILFVPIELNSPALNPPRRLTNSRTGGLIRLNILFAQIERNSSGGIGAENFLSLMAPA